MKSSPARGKPNPEFMRRAAHLAERARGYTAPNPCVGAVAVQDGHVVAEGRHTACGKPHAEVECIADARDKGVDLAACDLYVTLEPCNHHGRTPPCTEAILAAGIPRVIVGAADPNPDVAGGGMARLREAGVEVVEGVERELCEDLIADFLAWKTSEQPYVYLKLACTLDGKIATRTGHSRWVTGPESRAAVHDLRGRVQAVLVGGNTLYADDPLLTCRFGDADRRTQPLAVVATSRLPEADAPLALVTRRAQETVFLTSEEAAASPAAEALRRSGCRVWGLPGHPGDLNLRAGLARLRAEAGCWSVLCEGGSSLGLAMLLHGLVHELHLYLAPTILGDAEAKGLFTGRAPELMDEALRFSLRRTDRFGEDVRLVLRPH
ncbi:MAG: bifunctional diaminohydroxyphosphoribosylaminopyrimidine deaminase/5-amino-6-(5-phosphoribosylamino)uracil reductase RibD [Desulfovibrionaceae bacterium]|jgi:diaminohydroxyphosphoribosylaminopyrimidine deaminase/5-amino-6-(5-phosphoribosylamino)uracil reductase|nr:bifunctional diaminohydroxyphosphoribosylaminopyrimidine deaminase/5-amino-6-(5-phosphoribosylamino)uracil reductase RibD [Desulfovibrionaceae bacterium]